MYIYLLFMYFTVQRLPAIVQFGFRNLLQQLRHVIALQRFATRRGKSIMQFNSS